MRGKLLKVTILAGIMVLMAGGCSQREDKAADETETKAQQEAAVEETEEGAQGEEAVSEEGTEA